jgi:hypothetical protein
MMKFAMLAKPIEGYCIYLMGASVAFFTDETIPLDSGDC